MGVNGHCEHRKFMCGSENLKMGVSGVTKLKGIEGCLEIHTLIAIPMIRKKKKEKELDQNHSIKQQSSPNTQQIQTPYFLAKILHSATGIPSDKQKKIETEGIERNNC